VTRSAIRQLLWAVNKVTSGGAIIAPKDEPVTRMPKATLRERAGRTLDTVCTAAGNEGASLMPRRSRKRNRLAEPRASACAAETTDHTSTATTRPHLTPTRLRKCPLSGAATI